jgi:amidase
MPKLIAAVLLLCSIPLLSLAQTPKESWVVTTDLWGNPSYQALELDREGNKLTGSLDGDRLEGELTGNRIRFIATDASRRTYIYSGTIDGEKISGQANVPDTNAPTRRVDHPFSARRIPSRPSGPPRTHEVKPVDYSNEFSPHRAPILTVWPGDTVHTTTIDSGGVDEHGVTRALFGNPQTGPFFVATAAPGDTLAIKVKRLRPNRDYADSLDSVVGRALGLSMAGKAGDLGQPVRWRLDRQRGMAQPDLAGGRLTGFEVPMRPMLGGLAVAPGFGSPAISTGDTGRFGGNMDFNEVVEGNTIYLPVFQPGALLYLGDAHALQGDGETSQYALETSMDVEFEVDVIKGKAVSMPRVESPTHIMVLGQAGSLDEALRNATTGLIQWLQQDYDLSLSESAVVLGSSVEYTVANLAGRSVGLVAKLDKSRLAGLPIRKEGISKAGDQQ